MIRKGRTTFLERSQGQCWDRLATTAANIFVLIPKSNLPNQDGLGMKIKLTLLIRHRLRFRASCHAWL